MVAYAVTGYVFGQQGILAAVVYGARWGVGGQWGRCRALLELLGYDCYVESEEDKHADPKSESVRQGCTGKDWEEWRSAEYGLYEYAVCGACVDAVVVGEHGGDWGEDGGGEE